MLEDPSRRSVWQQVFCGKVGLAVMERNFVAWPFRRSLRHREKKGRDVQGDSGANGASQTFTSTVEAGTP